MAGASDHVLRNRLAWDQWAADYAGLGLHGWAAAEPSWGIWSVPEAQAGVLPAALGGLDSIELGCGIGYVPAWRGRPALPSALPSGKPPGPHCAGMPEP